MYCKSFHIKSFVVFTEGSVAKITCAGNPKLHVVNNTCHGHALDKRPLQVALQVCKFALGLIAMHGQ